MKERKIGEKTRLQGKKLKNISFLYIKQS